MGCFSPDQPDPVNYGQQTRDTLQAQVDLAPQLYANEARYQPLYANLSVANLNKILGGANGQPGLLELLRESGSAQRAADIGDVSALGPQSRSAILAANPDQAALLERMNAQALAGLDAEDRLTPDQQHNVLDPIRRRYASAGFAPGGMEGLEEGLELFGAGRAAQNDRRAFAGNVIGQNQAVVGDIFQQILGRPSGAVSQGQQVMGQSGPSIFNPESPLSASITSGNRAMDAMFATSTSQQVSNALAPMNESVSSY